MLRGGASVGWINPLPEGSWGLAGWIAVLHLDGRRAMVVTDDLGRPGRTASPARRWTRFTAPTSRTWRRPRRAWPSNARPARACPARGLGVPTRSLALGDGLVYLTWPANPGIQELQRGGRPVGWIELYDVERGTWIALIDSSIVSNAASGEPLRCASAGEALALLRLAIGQRLVRW